MRFFDIYSIYFSQFQPSNNLFLFAKIFALKQKICASGVNETQSSTKLRESDFVQQFHHKNPPRALQKTEGKIIKTRKWVFADENIQQCKALEFLVINVRINIWIQTAIYYLSFEK